MRKKTVIVSGVSITCKILIFTFICFQFFDLAYGDGWHISDRALHLYEPSQKAVILWDGKRETMILSSAVKSDDLANFAWVIPIQSTSKPLVTAGNIKIFEDLVEYFEKEKLVAPTRVKKTQGVQVLGVKEIVEISLGSFKFKFKLLRSLI